MIIKKFVLSVESKEEIADFKSKIKDGLIKSFEGADGVTVNVEDDAMLSEEEKKKKEAEALAAADAQAVKDKKIEELSQQFEAISKLQGGKDAKIAELTAKIAEMEKQYGEKTAVGEASVADMTKKLTEKDAEIKTLSDELGTIKKNTRTDSIKSFVKEQIEGGKILPKDETMVVALMEQLDDKAVVKFTKEDKETSEPLMDVLKKFITEAPKKVEFKEVSPETKIEHKIYEDKINIGGMEYEVKNLELVQKAEKFAQDHKVDFATAILEVSKEQK